MRTYLALLGICVGFWGELAAQRACSTATYLHTQIQQSPSLASRMQSAENFIIKKLAEKKVVTFSAREQQSVITIPVVVHILYHYSFENISDKQVASQLEMLNQCFRKQNADTANIPLYFKSKAADCKIEFRLAVSDPKQAATTGIIHKYTPITEWRDDDKVKFSSEMGDDAWDAASYLNIWVCNLKGLAGYASVPGCDPGIDGIVIDYSDFGPTLVAGYELGRTAVHETGHWLGLKHIWGDDYCGDDGVADTPPQSTFTQGCPTNGHASCNNASLGGDMYMNYMDYTNDACVNLFTEGQKERMRILFDEGGVRNSLLVSKGLNRPIYETASLPDQAPTWLFARMYPNPATDELKLDLAYDTRWIGKTITIYNNEGQPMQQVTITGKLQVISLKGWRPGMYFISARKEDGSYIKQKFLKL